MVTLDSTFFFTPVRPRRQDPLVRRPCRSAPASVPPDGRPCSPPPAASSPLDGRPVLSAAGLIQPAGLELHVPPACTDGNGQVVLYTSRLDLSLLAGDAPQDVSLNNSIPRAYT
jgi:hypothetical protein